MSPDRIRRQLQDIIFTLSFLTRFPLPAPAPDTPESTESTQQFAAALRYAPLAGVIIGAVGASVYGLCLWLGLSAILAAGLAVAAMLLSTGALHEDGLADIADGFGGGRDRARKLAIMSDSRIGTYGTVTLILCLLLRIMAVAELHDPARVAIALIASASLSRAFMYVAMGLLPPAKQDGLSFQAGMPAWRDITIAGALAAGVLLIALPAGVILPVLLCGAAAALLLAGLVKRQIGGQTGDALGAIQQVSELACLMALSVILQV